MNDRNFDVNFRKSNMEDESNAKTDVGGNS